MKNRQWMNVVMVILVAGLFLMVSCAKKPVVVDPGPIQNQSTIEADEAKLKAEQMEADRIKAQRLKEQLEKEKALAMVQAAKDHFVNQDVLFEYDSSELTSEAKLLLKEKAVWLQANPGVSVTVEGHCDERGTTDYNLALGERRAQTAKSYLVNLGVSGSRLSTISFGEEKPVDASATEAAYRKNRRAHFSIN
ncbi:MAG: peptidoglycan-associated lipoprotein Pal [Proteobacteria bacterium]|nr:peptidoglycan-associated lipoprotein Pal [Pseudomonadota bacterium]MBU1389429.1 peptidoglycan-associated lipoprotein Pal [Pseudomonadota bacterium]MBU1541249.1 peptidoglycan-associated lipoprotein Pal [Pseudomonadota bacterium]MBU2429312.1 peptidoglycan-associated lipoprotein Pal [Pseudomonadota bacterium]MBU2482441.1 peptidoglycan-associated lipoprotein Pal [Pseudomonadota bacterium]